MSTPLLTALVARRQARMLLVPFHIADSTIPQAGKGLFVSQAVRAGTVILAPDNVNKAWTWNELLALPAGDVRMEGSVRWFEDRYIAPQAWDEDCYINHSFEPNGLWLLGFVFAYQDLPAGTELTIDYRLLMADRAEAGFIDRTTGAPIRGLPWRDSIARSAARLAQLFAQQSTAQ